MNALFLLKKIISQFLSPMTFCLCLAFTGLYLARFTKKRRAGLVLSFSGILTLTLLSYNFASDFLVSRLESGVIPFERAYPAGSEPLRFVVVLAGSSAANQDVSASRQLGASTLERLVEGIRLYRKFPGSRLIVSGGAVFGSTPAAALMREAAVEMGVNRENILLEDRSLDTHDEAVLIRPMVGDAPFALVTSASHMKRSMALFAKQGMKPIAAPAGSVAAGSETLNPASFFPEASALKKSEMALHEYMGLVWARITGTI